MLPPKVQIANFFIKSTGVGRHPALVSYLTIRKVLKQSNK